MLIPCAECIERMKPEDPRVRSGRYNKCGCDYCGKSTYDREIENQQLKPQQVEVIYQQVTDVQISYLRHNLASYIDKKLLKLKNTQMVDKQKTPYIYIYSTIKEEKDDTHDTHGENNTQARNKIT